MNKEFKIYHTETQEDYDDLMIKLEDDGYLWASGDKPTSGDYWSMCGRDTIVYLGSWGEDTITRSNLSGAKKNYPTIPIIKYKSKGVKRMEKVVVPQFVADYIENHYGGSLATNWDRADLIRDWDNYIKTSGNSKVEEWVKDESNFLSFIMAIATNNYEVEIEKKCYWRKKKECLCDFEEQDYMYLNVHKGTGTLAFGNAIEISISRTLFTETEVKQLVSEEDFDKLEKVEIADNEC